MFSDSSFCKKANRLIHETSPYLLQHAYNPVDWYPWGEEALQKAKTENKAILVSIGYSACHWCHVMERESFENEDVAKIMNEHFVNIKIDREERPDLDHIYMDAVQAITGSGGWPLNVFLTPDKKPFYGGTYFPPQKAYNRSSWTDVLQAIILAWKERREEILEQADNLTDHLTKANQFGSSTKLEALEGTNKDLLKNQVDAVFQNIMKSADTEWGGFGRAPKFPQTGTIQYLFQYHYFTGNGQALDQALLSVDKMLLGGIYDQLGGGLSRYSTDAEWHVPHFEKMLYDNALFIMVLCDAYQLTKKNEYEKAIRDTIHFVITELGNGQGGFYSALDADSEGEEGRYYVWEKKEIDRLLQGEAQFFCDFFNITDQGNWEGKNILRLLKKSGTFSETHGHALGDFENRIEAAKKVLLAERAKRIRPILDDKILLGWNALMVSALSKAGGVLGDNGYIQLAENCFSFLIENLIMDSQAPVFYHSWKNGRAIYPAFLDDYGFLVQACINLQETTFKTSYLNWGKRITEHVIGRFSEPGTGYFFFTSSDQKDVIVRKKEVYDGATPSGNSTMVWCLSYLSVVFDKPEWRYTAEKSLDGLIQAIVNHPTSFANWASLIMNRLYGMNEIAITGRDPEKGLKELLVRYLPNKIVQGGQVEDTTFPLLTGKKYHEKTTFYLCKNYHCLTPVSELEELFLQVQNVGITP